MRIGRKLIDEISEAVFPSNIYCGSCGSLIDRSRPYSLCDKCIHKMHWINDGHVCEKCGKSLPDTFRNELCYDCMNGEHAFAKGYSCLTYGLHEREIMMDIKYGGRGYMARKMGDVLYDRMAGELNLLGSIEMFDAYRDLVAELGGCFMGKREGVCVDVIVPVPVSKGRMKKRGYNQSALMARQMRKRWKEEIRTITDLSSGAIDAPRCDEHVLVRCKETIMLRSLNPAQRSLALDGAFAVKSGTETRIRGKNVLLIDDIFTTGATCDSCSRALLAGGAENVFVLTLCSGGNRRPAEADER